MTADAVPWFEENDAGDVRRWALAALIVVGIHLAAIAAYVTIHRPDEIGDDSTPIAFDLAPSEDTVDQPEVAPVPEEEQKPVEEPPPPPPPEPPQAVVAPEPPPPPKVEEQKPPTPAMPARVKGGAPQIATSWETNLVKHLQQFKRYPSGAQSRGEEGIVLLSFTVDRTGHVLARQIARSSGHSELDAEVLSMIERAQPLPAFPPSMSEAQLDLTVPIRFSLR